METILITKDDIRGFWTSLDKNFTEEKLMPYILRAQQTDLKEFFGDAFYYDFVTNILDAKYQSLLNGGEYVYNGYTIYHSGVKQLLAAWSYKRILANINVSVGRASVVDKETAESVRHENDIIFTRSQEADSEAMRLQAEIRQFLNNERTEYPIWNRGSEVNTLNDTSFKITKVPRHRQR